MVQAWGKEFSSTLKGHPASGSVPITMKPNLGAGIGSAAAAWPVLLAPDDFSCRTSLVEVAALPRVPISCPQSMSSGTDCYKRAYTKVDDARLRLAKLGCIHAAERKKFEILYGAMQGLAQADGPFAPR